MTIHSAEDIPEIGHGLFAGLEEDLYHAFPACSNSLLSELKKSPAHAWYALTNKGAEADHFDIGTAVHAALLEPDKYESQYTLAEVCSASKADGTQCVNSGTGRYLGTWLCGVHSKGKASEKDDVQILTPSLAATVAGVSKSASEHPHVRRLLTEPMSQGGFNELTALWMDQKTGTPCKARLDFLSPDGKAIVDLKTTKDASPHAFRNSLYNFGYYRQAAMYTDAAGLYGAQVEDYYILAIEKTPPFGLRLYRLSSDAIEQGRREVRVLLDRFARCIEHDSWPGYDTDVLDLDLPNWAQQKEPDISAEAVLSADLLDP